MIICADKIAVTATSCGTTKSRKGAASSSGKPPTSALAAAGSIGPANAIIASGTPIIRIAFAGSANVPATKASITNRSEIIPASAGADSVASTM